MIVKMKFINISGPRTDIDRVCDQYLSKYEMQLENALTELKTTENLLPFVEVNPYKDALAKAESFVELLSDKSAYVTPSKKIDKDDLLDFIRDLNHQYLELMEKKELLKTKRQELQNKLSVLAPFQSFDFKLHDVLNFQFIKVRFGRIELDYFRRLEKFLYSEVKAIFLEGLRNENYVYGCYFVSNSEAGKADSVFSSMHFERIDIADEYSGTPSEAFDGFTKDIENLGKEIQQMRDSIKALMDSHRNELLYTRNRLEELSNIFDVRKVAARTDQDQKDYYILCGWMSEKDVDKFVAETAGDPNIFIVVEEGREKFFGDPPTKLKNPRIFKPFELFIRMYGLPSHNEMDPTIFVALTYTFIFGAMFGDLGQGLVLFILGGVIYFLKKTPLAGVLSIAGVFSAFFGFMFGSVFGFENIIHARWLKPMEAMTKLPFIGQLNTVFIIAIAFGMGINLLSMVFQIVNAAKCKDKENLWFSNNGVAGFVFYAFIVLTVVLYMTGHKTPGNILLLIFLGIPILMFLFKEPLGNLVSKNHKKIGESKGMFLVQGFFELFEVMLSYFSNTLSFVRIGAFAVSHAAIMEVVLMLSGASSGHTNIPIMIIGNIIVCGLEGLIVGIQVLRLEYYEMFSRFYKGTGREFKPFNNHDKATQKK
ncbi:MAG: ATPase [Lachnospiraceae bacterium]|jgi:V/A-type H+-transporting ATPase subunit I|nr:ATPase [Lachnospiraceae bacterium]